MLKFTLFICLVFNLLNSVSANRPQGSKPIRYLNPFFEQIGIQKNLEFGQTPDFDGKTEKLLLDIYSPKNDKETKRPVILWLHGGGFRPGNDKTQSYIVKLSTEFAKRGYVCIAINYRIRDNPKEDQKGTITDALADAMAGLNWIRTHHKKLGTDNKRIIMGGGSAGGMLAVNFCSKETSAAEKWEKSGILALVNLWGSPDSSYMFSTIGKSDPPTITVHGTADKLVSFDNSVQLQKQLAQFGIRHELVTIVGGEHTPMNHYDDFVEKIAAFIYAEVIKK